MNIGLIAHDSKKKLMQKFPDEKVSLSRVANTSRSVSNEY